MEKSRRDELEQFKRDINFIEFAASYGFHLVPKQTGKTSAVLKHPAGDKLVVSRSKSGHWVYFSVHSEESGTIVDFAQNRDRTNIGETRKKLRAWLGRSPTKAHLPSSKATNLQVSEVDFAKVMETWAKAKATSSHPYLIDGRKIPKEILTSPLFAGRVRIDSRGNALFPHFGESSSLCGFEIKNRNFTGFSPGGQKGLWCSRPRPDDQEIVVCETAIDALSYAALFGTEGKRFFSTAGQTSPLQEKLLKSAAEKMPAPFWITLALDNDEAGRKIARKLQQILESVPGEFSIKDHFPQRVGEDFNDVLRREQIPLTTKAELSF